MAVVSSLKISYVGCFGAGALFSVLNVLPYMREYEGTVPASKYLNLASMAQGCDLTGFYRTVSFFGIPIALPTIAIFASVLLLAIFMTAALIFYSKNFRLLRNKKKLFAILSEKSKFARRQREPKKILFATSFAAESALREICSKLDKIKNLTTEVIPVKSNYWGQNITVAGLITTDDLIASLKDKSGDFVVIPSVMLRPYSEDFLDGKTLSYVKDQTGKEFFVINNIYSMKELTDYLFESSWGQFKSFLV